MKPFSLPVPMLLLCGCLDWSSDARRAMDVDDDSGVALADDAAASMDAGDDEPGSDSDATVASDDAMVEGDEATVDGSDAMVVSDDAMVESSDATVADACPAGACPAAFPCVGSATDYVCQGQYAEFPLPIRSITDSPQAQGFVINVSEGTVIDTVTGLMWERVFGDYVTHPAAAAYCANLEVGGFQNWRLPSVHELVTWYGAELAPAFDDRVIRATQNIFAVWSSTPAPEADDSYWSVNVTQSGSGFGAADGDASRWCVRTHERKVSGTPGERFQLVDTLVLDRHTHLIWERTRRSEQSKSEAEAACARLTTGGRVFRLPSVAELISFIDYSQARSGPRTPAPFVANADYNWTRTRVADPNSQTFYMVASGVGELYVYDTADELQRAGARCVSPATP